MMLENVGLWPELNEFNRSTADTRGDAPILPFAMTVTDADFNIISVNPAFTRITGYRLEDMLGHNACVLRSDRHDKYFYKQIRDTISATGYWYGEMWNRRKNGELFLEWVNISAIYDGDGNITHYASVFCDVSERGNTEEKIRQLSHHDPLTNLPNRRLFYDRLEWSVATAQRTSAVLAVMHLDIDHFKYINDTLGHSVGDALIREVADALLASVRESDSVCRLGGDEFAILMNDIKDEKSIAYLANKLFKSIRRVYKVGGRELRVGVSMGISQFPADGDTPETLLKRADNAMHQAKREGRNRYQIFNQQLEHNAVRYMLIQQGLHRALENGEFCIHYQPKFSLDDHRAVGAEALMRWEHPALGAVSPTEFIPIAEESDFIIELGDWLIEQVCSDLADWQASGFDVVPVAVNISPAHFHRGNVGDSLLRSMKQHRLSPSLLQVELTEGIVMNSRPQTVTQLRAIKDLGIAISIDDFGTGYSSLNYLRRLPIDELKIDRSFIMEITDENCLIDSRLTAIPSTIIELAQKLQLKLVAEGVETEVQSNFLKDKGCNIVQGYLFSRPLDKQAMSEWFETESRSK